VAAISGGRRGAPSTGASHACLLSRIFSIAVVSVTVTALFSLTGSSLSAPSPHVRIHVPSAFFGIHDGSGQSYAHLDVGSVRLWDAGVSWKDVETTPGTYSWSRLDSLVSAAQQHGAEVTFVIAMTPSFYAASPTQPPTDLAHYADYLRALMTHYRDFNGSRGIDAYQVWNEGNISTFWTGTPHQLAELTRIADQVRDEVDPGAVVLAPSFAVRLPYQLRFMADYEEQRVGGKPVWRYVDANAPSLYPKATYGLRIGEPEDGMRLLARVRSLLAHAGVPAGMPLWASEVNYGVASSPDGPVAATPISDRHQVANIMRTYLLGAARGLARLFWYRYDWNVIASVGGTLGNTLLTVPGDWDRITPAGRAFDTVQRWLDGRLVGRHGKRPCARDRRGTYTCVVVYAGGTRRIMWNPRHAVRVGVSGAAYREDAVGVRSRISRRGATIRVSYEPVMVVSR